ncbi:hypothetical protein [Prescottella equi]|nr:hypothetical protein [Prescottella equi]
MDGGADITTFTVHHEILVPDGDEPDGYGEITVEVDIDLWEHNA